MKANERANHKVGDTYRSKCGRVRVTFRPDWSETLPWVSYRDGTAGRHYGTLNGAVQQIQYQYNLRIVLPTVEEQQACNP